MIEDEEMVAVAFGVNLELHTLRDWLMSVWSFINLQ